MTESRTEHGIHPFLDDETEVVEVADALVTPPELERLRDWLKAARARVGFDFDTVCLSTHGYKIAQNHRSSGMELVTGLTLLREGISAWVPLEHGHVAIVAVEGQAPATVVFQRHERTSELAWDTCPGCGGAGKYVGLRHVEDPCRTCRGRGEIRND